MQIMATVTKVELGKHGPFAIAVSREVKGSITFSLNDTVWQETSLPEHGTVVLLSGLQKKQAGWRATAGRFLKPSDESK